MADVYIGTSGWVYDDWWGKFYPKNIKQGELLEYYSKSFSTVELNASFYHLPRKKTFENWHEKTPPNFVFSTKLSRYITQNLKLKNSEEPLELFLQEASGLGNKLSVVLVQLPPNFGVDKERLERFLVDCARFAGQQFCSSPNPHELAGPSNRNATALVPMETQKEYASHLASTTVDQLTALVPRFAFEFRHESWLCDEIYELLQKYKVGFVIQDSVRWPKAKAVTSDFVYLRFHGPGSLYSSNYPDKVLKSWAEKIEKWLLGGLDVYAYFNNDINAYAVKNALTLKELTSKPLC